MIQISYTELSSLYENKFRRAKFEECTIALKDIDKNLLLYKDANDPYNSKLLCERNAVVYRKFKLK